MGDVRSCGICTRLQDERIRKWQCVLGGEPVSRTERISSRLYWLRGKSDVIIYNLQFRPAR
jgi:hypothetical protein